MTPRTHIREVRPEEYHSVADIYNQHIRQGNATMDETLKTASDIASWIQAFHSREKLLVLTENDAVVGWGIIKRYSDREGYRFACETAVYLASGHVRKGYGSLMKKRLIAECKELKYKHLVAKIFADNTGSIEYNRKLGYTIVGRQEKIGFKNGNWQDIIIMQYVID